MFRAPLCPSSGAREYYTSGIMGCSPQTGHTTLSSTPYRQLENQAPNMTGSNHLHNTLELLMMGIMVPETCCASNKICNKNPSVASSWHFISAYYWRCTVKTTSNTVCCTMEVSIAKFMLSFFRLWSWNVMFWTWKQQALLTHWFITQHVLPSQKSCFDIHCRWNPKYYIC